MTIEIKVPDIGDFKDVPVIEIHVQPGQTVKGEDPLVTLESDKATMDIPAPQAGTVGELKIKVGDRVGEGAVILTLEPEGAAAIPPKDKVKEGAAPASGEPAGYGSSAGVYETIEVKVPDIGDFRNVPVIEIIGLEMATVYHALGSKVTIVELMDQIIPGADKDIVTPLMKRIEKRYAAIHLKTKVTKGLLVSKDPHPGEGLACRR